MKEYALIATKPAHPNEYSENDWYLQGYYDTADEAVDVIVHGENAVGRFVTVEVRYVVNKAGKVQPLEAARTFRIQRFAQEYVTYRAVIILTVGLLDIINGKYGATHVTYHADECVPIVGLLPLPGAPVATQAP